MIDLLQSLKSLIQGEEVHTDNNVFKLHYKLTVVMLAGFSVLLTSKQYFGNPIDCDVESKKETIDTYCWIYGTFVNKHTLADQTVPGLGNENSGLNITSKQTYYQWVCLCFGLQAVFFYIPRYLWTAWEGGCLKSLISDLGGPLVSSQWSSITKESLIKFILNSGYTHNVYTIRYCFCEILNFVNVIVQIYFMDWLMSGSFSTYGVAHASFKLVNPMNSVFPKVAKCTYFNYGPTGSVQRWDALCVLPLNVLNEKLFLALWYWLFFLLVLSLGVLLHRSLFLFIPTFRVYLLRAQVRKLDASRANQVVNNLSFGDFFMLYRIGKNVNPILYRDLVLCIFDNLNGKKSKV